MSTTKGDTPKIQEDKGNESSRYDLTADGR